ncbi:MAG TPA: hypothetical protein VH744_10790 [Terriglobales bacterium]|jgi:hypothetical protein
MKRLLLVMSVSLVMAACTSEPPKPAETAKPQPTPPEALTGRAAFQRLYAAARGWAYDARPYRLESYPTTDANGHAGKAAIWRGSFGSTLQRGAKPYVWSGSNAPDAPSRGINPGVEDTYNPSNASTQVFDAAFLKIDSDKAFEVAQKHGGDKLLAKTPDAPVLYMLEWSRPTSQLIWHVMYGPSRDTASLRVAVDASSGDFIRVEK